MLRAGGICAARACRLDLVLLEKRVANALVVGPAAHPGRVGEQVALDELFVHTRRAHTDEADEHEAHASRHGCGLVQQLAAVHCKVAQLLRQRREAAATWTGAAKRGEPRSSALELYAWLGDDSSRLKESSVPSR